MKLYMQNKLFDFAPSHDSVLPIYKSSLIKYFAWCLKKAWVPVLSVQHILNSDMYSDYLGISHVSLGAKSNV